MTDDLPEPLTPPTCDLRDFAFMPLDVVRLRDSDLAATPDGEIFRAAVLAWCCSWHQLPAASLPDDDALLARLLGYGRDVRGWAKLRAAGALRGFIKCSDGRLYHPVVAEKAITAWEAKQAQRNRTQKAREVRLSQRAESPVTDHVTGSKGEGQGQCKGEGVEESAGADRHRDLLGDTVEPANPSEILDSAFASYAEAAGRCGWQECRNPHDGRRRKLAKRLKEAGGLEGWRAALARAEASDFLMGRKPGRDGGPPFRMRLDFLLQISSFTELMEGKYDNRTGPNGIDPNSSAGIAARVAARRASERSLGKAAH